MLWTGTDGTRPSASTVVPMGQNNQARRAAKAKERARARARSTGRGHDRQQRDASSEWLPHDGYLRAWELWHSAALALTADARHPRLPIMEVRALDRLDPAHVDRAAEEILAQLLDAVWRTGWQPAEVLRQSRRNTQGALPSVVAAAAVAVDHAGRPPTDLDPRWQQQVSELDLPDVDRSPGWLGRWRATVDHQRREVDAALASLMSTLTRLPPVEELIPPPGAHRADRPSTSSTTTAHPMLQRIRALLNKAESTQFEAEASALTEKAQELMTRHAIDEAMVQEVGSDSGEPGTLRIAVDAPYADVKSLLLQIIAEASRCRSAFSPAVAISTVIGFPGDLEAVELLYTSLLVQAQHALTEAGRGAGASSRTRSQSYRSAFLLSFTRRIGERLERANAHVYEQAAADSGRFLPVLRSQQQRVDEAVQERFGALSEGPVRGGYDAAGRAQGTIAADAAQLAFGDLRDAGH